MRPQNLGPLRAKAFGAFYTHATVANFIIRWALRHPGESVLDPSFGGGIFLEEAATRLASLGKSSDLASEASVYGVELDLEVHGRISSELKGVAKANLIHSDFFALEPSDLPPMDAVVGNPPFIRFQSFNSEKAAVRARAQGVTLTKLSSSWAPFLVHSTAFVKPGGRLGMVIPAELMHAAYARPLLEYLTHTFKRVTLLTFKTRLFPDISQDTLLLLAEGKGEAFTGLFWRDVGGQEELQTSPETLLADTERLPEVPLIHGKDKLITRLIPNAARDLYEELAAHPKVFNLGALAHVGIGYVTGANSFFHLSPERAEALALPPESLSPAVFRSAALTGLTFGAEDWQKASREGNAGYLLNITSSNFTPELQSHLEQGERDGVSQTYKCRTRTPWYGVPHVYKPDALLTYMSGLRPQLVANSLGAVAPNTLHVVRLRSEWKGRATALAAGWQTSLTSLSVELEGHALGGGMLKLEPGEARQVLMTLPSSEDDGLEADLDSLLRANRMEEARSLADLELLRRGLGLSQRDCATLREAAQTLQGRRYYRTRAASGKTRASLPPPPAS